MKKTALLVAAVLAGSSLQAQEPASAYSVTLDFSYVSEYVFRGISLADDAIQPSVELAVGDFYAGIWTSMPITKKYNNEFDFYAGYGLALSDTWALDLGATYYYYPESSADDDQFEPFVGLTGEIGGGFSSSYYMYYETEFETFTYQGSLGYTIPLSDQASLDLSGTVGFVDPDTYLEEYVYWGAGAVISYALTNNASAYVGANYASHDLDGVEDDHFYANVGVTIGF